MPRRTAPRPVVRRIQEAFLSVGEIFFLRAWPHGAALWSALLLLTPAHCLTGTAGLAAAPLLDHAFRVRLPDASRALAALNAFLVGLGFSFLRGPVTTFQAAGLLAGTLFLHQLLFYALHAALNQRARLPVLTLPFLIIHIILTTTGAAPAGGSYPVSPLEPVRQAEEMLSALLPAGVAGYFRALGALFFTRSLIFGIVLGAAMLAYSRILFSLSIGVYLPLLLLREVMPSDQVFELTAFNCIVAVLMIAAVLEVPSRWSYRNALLFGILTLLLAAAWSRLPVPLLNIPFLLTIAAYLLTRPFLEQTGALPFDFLPGTPEQNLYYAENRRDRYAGIAAAPFMLPFNGTWIVTQAHEGALTHREAWRHAWDFEVADPDGRLARNGGELLTDYHAYRLPVCASLEGEVVNLQGHVAENPPGRFNFGQNWGNTVVLRHATGICTAYSHLSTIAPGLFPGKWVMRGEVLGTCGNSGRSERPHLHFQFQGTARIGEHTLPMPLKRYGVIAPGGVEVRMSALPQEGERVMNIPLSPRVLEAFSFPFGRTLTATGVIGAATATEHWVSTVDFANHTYLFCEETGAAAYFFMDDGVLYVTDYFGPRRTLLDHFALACSRIVCAEEPVLTYADRLPLNRVRGGPATAAADILSPLFPVRELHAHYRLTREADRTVRIASRIVSLGRLAGARESALGEFVLSLPYGTTSIRIDGTLLHTPSSIIIS